MNLQRDWMIIINSGKFFGGKRCIQQVITLVLNLPKNNTNVCSYKKWAGLQRNG